MNLRDALLRCFALLALAAAAGSVAQIPAIVIPVPQTPKLTVGELAPPLSAARWIKGTPIRALGNGKVTVVEFFASWCPTCRETFAHVAELSRKYEGKASFLGVSVWESPADVKDGSYAVKVRNFAVGLGDRMPYAVAVDDPRETLADEWLGATSADIPKAFIIDREGQIAWAGHPLADLDETLSSVVSGRFDMVRAKAESEAQIAAVHELISLVTPIQEAIRAQRSEEAIKAIDVALRKKPDLESGLGPTRFQMLLRLDESSAYAYARELALGPCRDSSSTLNLIAWTIVADDSHLKSPDYATAVQLAQHAFDLENHKDPYIADTLAYALFKRGDRDRALTIELQAVRLAEKTAGIDAKTMKEIRARLALIRKAAPPAPQ